jgi:hypothetical protein
MVFPPTFMVAFPPETHSKSVHYAFKVTTPNQKVISNAYPNIDHKALLVGGNEQMQHEGLYMPKHGCCGC